jgi:hypothetical protein
MCLYWGIIPTLSEEPIEKVNIRSYVANWTQQYTDFPPGEMIVIVTDIEVIAGIHDSVLLTRTV